MKRGLTNGQKALHNPPAHAANPQLATLTTTMSELTMTYSGELTLSENVAKMLSLMIQLKKTLDCRSYRIIVSKANEDLSDHKTMSQAMRNNMLRFFKILSKDANNKMLIFKENDALTIQLEQA